MIIWDEILLANGTTMLMMLFLLNCRQKNRETIHTEDKIYDMIILINLLGAVIETFAFLVTGKDILCGRLISYLINSICFACTASIAFLWCLYVDLRIYRNYKRTFHNAKIIMIPWLIVMAAIICNLFGTGILFVVSESNVYQRCRGAILGYITLTIYIFYSIYLVYHSKKLGINLNFFPVLYFVGPALVGTLIHSCRYGVSTPWISVALALTFVQMQLYAENLCTDDLSGLYNRRYLNSMLMNRENTDSGPLYGIMMDINDFKSINDRFGHDVGDRAICATGNILFKSIPNNGIAIRYAGDEFIVLLLDVDEKSVFSTMDDIKSSLLEFNKTGGEPFVLGMSMGYAKFDANDDAKTFLIRMDEKMYEQKRMYHQISRDTPDPV